MKARPSSSPGNKRAKAEAPLGEGRDGIVFRPARGSVQCRKNTAERSQPRPRWERWGGPMSTQHERPWPAIDMAELRYGLAFGSSVEEMADFLQSCPSAIAIAPLAASRCRTSQLARSITSTASVDYRCAFWSVKARETLRILQGFRPWTAVAGAHLFRASPSAAIAGGAEIEARHHSCRNS